MYPTKPYHQYTDYSLEPGGLRKLDFIVEKIQNSFAKNSQELTILDVGAGNGNIALPLAYLGYQVTALDADKNAIEVLKAKNPPNNLEINLSMFENYQPNKKFDVIIMSEFLEHTKEPEKVLAKVKRILNENGFLILTVPNALSLEESLRRLFKSNTILTNIKTGMKKRMQDKEIQSPAQSSHLQFWSLFSLKALLKSAGFKIKEISAATFLFKEAYYIFARFILKRDSWLFHQFDKIDSRMAKSIPPLLASGWIIVAKSND